MTMAVAVALFGVIIVSVSATPLKAVQRSIHLTPEIIISEGYHAERHHVVTTDGYVLEMHRIPFKRHEHQGSPDRPVVFLMHGLLAASNSYIALGHEYAVGYNLADAGFDVWMGNARGSQNSRRHVTMNPDDRNNRAEFFDFTWEEIGMYDISGMVDYVLESTGKEKLHYIGHSQGGTVFLVLNTMRPEYNEKFASAHLLAGVGYMRHFPNIILRPVAQFTNTIYGLATALGLVEMFPSFLLNNANTTEIRDILDYCTENITLKNLCELSGVREIADEKFPDLGIEIDLSAINQLGGASFKQVAHYGQNIQANTFQRWDFGTFANLDVYGSREPPAYDLRLITVNVTMHYTVSDSLLDERDVLAMVEVMPNTVARRVARDSFRHADFVFAMDAKELVTDYIIESINAVEFPQTEEPETEATDASSNLVLSFVFKVYLIICSVYYILL